MSENISDVDLERFLRRRDRISREYLALASEGPAPALDARVLATAREALETEANASGWRRRRWPTIMALAATVLLSLGLILRVALESDQAVFAPPPIAERERAARDESIPVQSAGEQPAALPPARATDPAPPELPRPQIEAAIRTTSERSKLAAPASAPIETRAESHEQFEEKRRDGAAAPQAGLMKEEALRVEQANEPAPAVAEPPAPASAESDADRAYAPKKDAVSPARAPKGSQRALKNMSTVDEAQRMRDPEIWLGEIEKLRAAGRVEEADREMERFVAAYPRYLEQHPRPPTE